MSQQGHGCHFRLKRRRLGVCLGEHGEVYVADAKADPPTVHVIPGDYFIEAVRSGWIRAGRWCAAMPRRDCLLKRISLPAESEEEARQMLAFELPGLVPMQDGGFSYDVMLLHRGEEGTAEFLVFLTPRNRIERAMSVLREAGVIPDVVWPDSVALWRWMFRRVEDAGSALLMCVEPTRCQIVATVDGRFQGARELALAADEVVDIAVLLAEAQRVCPGETELEIGESRRVLLAGRSELAGALADQLRSVRSEAGGAEPVDELHTSAVRIESGAWGELQGEVSDIAVLSALGCAWESSGQCGDTFNLVPAEWQEGRVRRRRRMEWVKTLGLAVSVPVLLWLLLAVRIVRLEARCALCEREMAPIKDVAAALEVKKRQERMIQAQLSDRALPLEVLAELYGRVPEGLHLSHLTMDLDPSEPQLVMKGPAGSLEAAFAFPLVLDESPLFVDVRPEAAQQVSRGQGVLIEFGCRCRIDVSRKRKAL